MEIKCKLTTEDPKLLLKTLNATEDIVLLDQDYPEDDMGPYHLMSIIFNKDKAKLDFTDSIFINKNFYFAYDYTKLKFDADILVNTPSIEKLKEFIVETDIEIWICENPNLPI